MITLTKTQLEIENSKLKVASINSKIEKSSGIEQEMLNREIADIRAELAGLNVKIENYESKISQIARDFLVKYPVFKVSSRFSLFLFIENPTFSLNILNRPFLKM